MKTLYRLQTGWSCLTALLLITATSLRAQDSTVTWTGKGGDGLWSTAENWSGGKAPQSADNAIIQGNAEGKPTTLKSNQDVHNVTIGRSGKGAVVIESAGHLSTNQESETNGIFVGRDRGTGELTIQGGSVSSNGGFHVAENSGSTGIVTLEDGNVVSNDVVFLGRGGKATFNQSGGSFTANNPGHSFRMSEQDSSLTVYNMSGGYLNVHRHMQMGNPHAGKAHATWNISGSASPRVGSDTEGDFYIRGHSVINLESIEADGTPLYVSGSLQMSGGNNTLGFIIDDAAIKDPAKVRKIDASQDLAIESAHNYVLPRFAEGVSPKKGTWTIIAWGRDLKAESSALALDPKTAKGWSLQVDKTKRQATVSYEQP